MTDETDTVRRIIIDCIDAELRWNATVTGDTPIALAERITAEIMDKLTAAGIRTIRESFPLGGDG